MKLPRIASWVFECFASMLALYSIWIVMWMLREVIRDIAGPALHAGPGGMPGNAVAGVAIAIWLGSGALAAVLAYLIAVAAEPFDRTTAAWCFGRWIQRTAIVGFGAPFALLAASLAFG